MLPNACTSVSPYLSTDTALVKEKTIKTMNCTTSNCQHEPTIRLEDPEVLTALMRNTTRKSKNFYSFQLHIHKFFLTQKLLFIKIKLQYLLVTCKSCKEKQPRQPPEILIPDPWDCSFSLPFCVRKTTKNNARRRV